MQHAVPASVVILSPPSCCLLPLHINGALQPGKRISSNPVPAVKEWEVLAQQSLDAVLELGADSAADELGLSSASITWRGDGKYFATVSLSTGKSLMVSQLAKTQHVV